jgi:D-amino-acid oxidase
MRRILGLNYSAWPKMSLKLGFICKVFRNRYKTGCEMLIGVSESVAYSRKKDAGLATLFSNLGNSSPWFKSMVPNFRVIPSAELPPSVDSGITYTSLCINTMVYLPYLLGRCLQNGAVIKREIIKHISEAADLHHSGQKADLVVNCTGLLSGKLGGVMDKDVIPIRGQVVVVRNDPGVMLSISGTDDGDDELLYIMQRGAGGGTVLGGTYQKGSWESQPDPSTAVRIMKRAVELCPTLTGGKGIEALSIIRHGVGLRPYRSSGVRVEKEKIEGTWVVHNYGHGGWGYQGSYGCSEQAVELADEVLGVKAKL